MMADTPKQSSPSLLYICACACKAFAKRSNDRHDFLKRGALTRVQRAAHGSRELQDALEGLNATFPGQMVSTRRLVALSHASKPPLPPHP